MVFTLLAAAVFRKRRPWFWIIPPAASWILLLLATENDGLPGSMGRFAAALFPVPVALALFAKELRWAQPVFLAFNVGTARANRRQLPHRLTSAGAHHAGTARFAQRRQTRCADTA